MNVQELEEGRRAVRHHVDTMCGCRRDALFDLLDAVLTAPTPETPAHVSLVPTCQRGWGTVYKALTAGTKDLRLHAVLIASDPLASETA